MERSLSAVVFFTVLAALTSTASAQTVDPAQPPACEHHGRGGRGGPGARVDFMIHMLGLDEHQAAAVRQIVSDTQPERERIRAMPRGSAEQIAARQELEQQTHARIDALLDDTQRAQLARMREWRQQHPGMGGRGGRGGMRGHRGGRGGAAPPTGI
jgi:hypothetical protein